MAIRFDHKPENQPGLVIYLTAGDPSLEATRAIAIAAIDAGADVIELGVPFSDPLADGPVIQRASERAIAAGTTLPGALGVLAVAAEGYVRVGLRTLRSLPCHNVDDTSHGVVG